MICVILVCISLVSYVKLNEYGMITYNESVNEVFINWTAQ